MDVALSGHALAETYSVLSRLPGDLRLTPAVEHGATLATRDARAQPTYETVGVHVVVAD
jgi:hypothetical protein